MAHLLYARAIIYISADDKRRCAAAKNLQRAQQVAAACRAACDMLKGAPKSSRDDPHFMDNYYKASRLHFIGTWKARIEALAAKSSGKSTFVGLCYGVPLSRGTRCTVYRTLIACYSPNSCRASHAYVSVIQRSAAGLLGQSCFLSRVSTAAAINVANRPPQAAHHHTFGHGLLLLLRGCANRPQPERVAAGCLPLQQRKWHRRGR